VRAAGHLLAPPDTRHGQLQRGRGAGFRAALAAGPAAHTELLDCLRHDPRQHPALEERCRFFAELLVATNLPVAAVVETLATSPAPELGQAVLAGAFRLGHAPAIDLLADPATPTALLEGITAELWAREWAVRTELPERAAAAWLRLSLGEADCAVARRPRPSASAMATLSVTELLELARDERNAPRNRLVGELCARDDEALRQQLLTTARSDVIYGRVRLAARVLGLLGDERLLPLAEELFGREDLVADARRRLTGLERMRRACCAEYVQFLPEVRALNLARSYHGRGGYFTTVAGTILRELATAADRNRLESFVAAHRNDHDALAVLDELDALGRLADPGSAPLLAAVAADSSYSQARRRAVAALAAMPGVCAEPPASALLEEALWDCEDETAAVAVAFLPQLDAAAIARVQRLAVHPLAAEELRARARRRLARMDLSPAPPAPPPPPPPGR
jgi:hypothetical protein